MRQFEDEKPIRQYLLGTLAEDEQTQLEERLLTDQDYFDLSLAVEDDLIDDYLSGGLAPQERAQFEQYFLATTVRQQKVRLAQTFHRYLADHAESVRRAESASSPTIPAPGARPASSLLGYLRAQSRLVQFALASSGLLIILGGLGLFIKVGQLQQQLAQERAQNSQLAETLEQAEERQTRLQQELTQLRREPVREPALPPPGEPPSSVLASAFLAPGLTRSSGESNRVALSAWTQTVELKLDLPTDEFQTYRAVLVDDANRERLTATNLKLEKTGDRILAIWRVPAHQLPPGDYQVRVTGLTSGGAAETFAPYALRVTKK